MNRKETRAAKGKLSKGGLQGGRSQPPDVHQLHNIFMQAVGAYQGGKSAESAKLCRAVLARFPQHADALHLLGIIEAGLGNIDTAADLLTKSVALNPNNPECQHNLGNIHRQAGHANEAISCYRMAISLSPGFALAYCNMGNVFQDLGRLADAAACYRRALDIRPDFAEVMCNLAATQQAIGQAAQAVGLLQRAIEVKPGYAPAHCGLGNALLALNKPDEAVPCYRQAIALDPSYEPSYDGLAGALFKLGLADDAASVYRLGAPAGTNKAENAVKAALFLPQIQVSSDDNVLRREKLAENVAIICGMGASVRDPFGQINLTNFFSAYHGENERDIQTKLADMHLRLCPQLAWNGPTTTAQADRKIKVGFYSKFFTKHTIAKLTLGIISKLDRNRFEVVVFRDATPADEMSARIEAAADRTIPIAKTLDFARSAISAENLDILVYPEIGMDPFTYFLAFSRLAGVQLAMWGHPVTTGIPTIDYFLSSHLIEPEDAQAHYSEKLLLMRNLPVYYERPQGREICASREEFGFSRDDRLYVCPQSLFKFHPTFDGILGKILRQDDRAKLVLISGDHPNWNQQLLARLTKSTPEAADKATFLPVLQEDAFLRLLRSADALLDTTVFSGGYSSFEAFSLGCPIVTMPGQFMRGRVTTGIYRAMDMDDLVATSDDDYAQLAVRLANDKAFQHDMRGKVLERCQTLYEKSDVIREIEDTLARLVTATQNGNG